MMKQRHRIVTILCIFITNTLLLATAASAAGKSMAAAPKMVLPASKIKMNRGGAFSMNKSIRPSVSDRAKIRPPGTSTSRIRNEAIKRARQRVQPPSQTVQQNRIDPTVGNRAPSELKTPEISTNLRDPNRGPRNPGEMRPDWQQPEPAPLPDGLDPNKIPGRDDPREDNDNWPDPEPTGPQRGGAFSRWIPGETTPDGTPLWTDNATRERWQDNPPPDMNDPSDEGHDEFLEWIEKYDGGDNDITYGAPLVPGNGTNPIPSSSDNGDDEDKIITLEELNAVQRDPDAYTDEDPEPEGDDPDEMRGRMASEQRVITGGGRTGQGQINPVQPSSNHGRRKPGEQLPGESIREHGQRITSGTPIPEDGGPDESVGAGRVAAMDKERLNLGQASKPAPDAGEGGGPVDPGPNATQGQVDLSSAGQAAYPTPDAGQGGGPIDPGPNAVQGQLNLTSAGQAAYPTPDAGQGGGPIDPGPNAAQ